MSYFNCGVSLNLTAGLRALKVCKAACRPTAVKKLTILPSPPTLRPVITLVIFLQGCRERLPGKATGQGCRARLPGKTAGQDCRARLPGRLPVKSAGQGCRARLLGKAAGQDCQARLPGKAAKSMVK
jgi:hypothetical protein